MNALLPGGGKPLFIIDANVWISAHSETYAQDVFPGVWERLSKAASDGVVASPQEVIDEVAGKDDAANAWVTRHKGKLLSPLAESGKAEEVDEVIVPKLQQDHGRLPTRTGADYYVVGWAKALECPVVTMEKQRGNRIPVVCGEENIKCMSLLQCMRMLQWRFE